MNQAQQNICIGVYDAVVDGQRNAHKITIEHLLKSELDFQHTRWEMNPSTISDPEPYLEALLSIAENTCICDEPLFGRQTGSHPRLILFTCIKCEGVYRGV